jgi:AdoMet-dependent heme synthase
MHPTTKQSAHPDIQRGFDFSKKPFLVIWETTHACDLACVHCRANAEPDPAPSELTHEEAKKFISDVHALGTLIFVFSGGDPLKRADLPELLTYAKSLGLRTGVIPAVTEKLTNSRIASLQKCGLDQIAFSLDAARADVHDAFRRTKGVFEHTLSSVRYANQIGLAVQVNSLVNVHNQETLDELTCLIETLDIVFWEVFFLVPVGRGEELSIMSAEKFEEAFEKIYQLSKRTSFIIKITEAPHYRRFYIEKEMVAQNIDPSQVKYGDVHLPMYLKKASGPRGSIGRAPSGVNAGKGFAFVSCQGEVFPSGFLPLTAGNVREKAFSEIYQDSLLLKELRDSSLLKGRCGRCAYRDICGGSRSRAFAMAGDYLAEDPSCAYQPPVECS